jgi:threonine/homoserine/homoserine lactone efflux protein
MRRNVREIMPMTPLLSAEMALFFAAYMVIVMTPGSATLATGSVAAHRGLGGAIPFVAGIATGVAALATLAALAAEPLSTSFPLPVLQLTGAVVLACMAVRIAFSRPPVGVTVEPRRSQTGLLATGLLVSITSPMQGPFLVTAFAGPTLPLHGLEATSLMIIGFGIITLAWHLLIAIALSRPAARTVVFSHYRPLCVVAACLLTAMAVSSIVPLIRAPPEPGRCHGNFL